MEIEKVVSETHWFKRVIEQAKTLDEKDQEAFIDKEIGLLMGALKVEVLQKESNLAENIVQKINQDL
jgi:hypothetical protein